MKSSIFGGDEDPLPSKASIKVEASEDSVAPAAEPEAPVEAAIVQKVAEALESVDLSAETKPVKKSLHPQMQSNIFGYDEQPQPLKSPRKAGGGILPVDDKPAARSGRRQPEGIAPNFKSNFSLSDSSMDSERKQGVTPPALRSSITFGDDGPKDPDFSPKRPSSSSRRIITPPGGMTASSLAEFTGVMPEDSCSSGSDKTKKRLDPSTMAAAGSTTELLAIYYIVEGTIYQSPDAFSLVSNRLLTSLYHVRAGFETLRAEFRFQPSQGYHWASLESGGKDGKGEWMVVDLDAERSEEEMETDDVGDGDVEEKEKDEEDDSMVLTSRDSQRNAYEFMKRVDGLISGMRAEAGLSGSLKTTSKASADSKKPKAGVTLTIEELKSAAKARMEALASESSSKKAAESTIPEAPTAAKPPTKRKKTRLSAVYYPGSTSGSQTSLVSTPTSMVASPGSMLKKKKSKMDG
ncbi:Mediator of RNA polymerase II transcription subunit 6 [Chytridiales sp. JEL 0842]|nr:Mediator of RNA polymerase II transcription subunit 6 [Chytridiales sp. JEL 0842]